LLKVLDIQEMRAKTFKGRLGALEGIERQRKKYSEREEGRE